MVIRLLLLFILGNILVFGSQRSVNAKFKKDIMVLKKDILSLSKKQISEEQLNNYINQSIVNKLSNIQQSLTTEVSNSINKKLINVKKYTPLIQENKNHIIQINKVIRTINKNLINKKTIENIIIQNDMQKYNQIQAEYRTSILSTNTNMTYVGYLLGFLGMFITIISIILGNILKKDFTVIQDKVNNKMLDIDNKMIDTNDKLVENLDGHIKVLDENYKLKIENESKLIYEKIIQKLIKDFEENIKTNVKTNIDSILIPELKNATNKINKIHYFQYNLIYNIEKLFTTKLANTDTGNFKKLSEEYGIHNIYYQKIAAITSLEREIMIPALKELQAPNFSKLINLPSMREYLEYLKEYDTDNELRMAINGVMDKMRR